MIVDKVLIVIEGLTIIQDPSHWHSVALSWISFASDPCRGGRAALQERPPLRRVYRSGYPTTPSFRGNSGKGSWVQGELGASQNRGPKTGGVLVGFPEKPK